MPVELNSRYSSPVDFEKQIVSKYLCLPENNLGVDDKCASCKKGYRRGMMMPCKKFADEVLSFQEKNNKKRTVAMVKGRTE